jgi:hypothetical protein
VEGAWLIRRRDVVNKKQKPFCLVNVSAVSIHHVASEGAIWRSAFIFDERRRPMVNRFLSRRRVRPRNSSRCEPRVKLLLSTKTRE